MRTLETLKINYENNGVCLGPEQWLGGNNKLASINPSDESVIAHVLTADEKHYEAVVNHAQQAAMQWREVPAPKRGEIVRQIGLLLREHKDALGSLVALEMGKSKQEGDGEVQEMIDMADFAVGQSRMLYGKTMHSERAHHRMYEQWHPYGVMTVITAFNFPVAVWAWNAFLSAICGNVTIWKPSSKVPLCAIAVIKLCNEVLEKNNMPGIFPLFICQDRSISDRFLSDTRIPLISFTGSTQVGRHVAASVQQRLGKCILELGGNNAIIVDETANLALAIPAIVFGAIGTAGQRCTSTRRVIVHKSVFEKVSLSLSTAYQSITIGDPLDKKNLMGPLIDQAAVDAYEDAVREIKSQGGKILFGGAVKEGKGYFVEPCLAQAQNEWDIVQRETFAPILYLMPYQNLEQAIDMHNGVKQGLSSAIFTQNLQNAEYFLSHLGSDCGIANVNIGTSGAEIGGAFGGEKDTGGGRESGSDAWKSYMRRQTTTINWSDDMPLAQGIEFKFDR